ncbi:neuromedin-U receptor 2-like [Oculina patagonica]
MASTCTETNVTFPVYLTEPFPVMIFRIGLQIAIGIFGVIGNVIVCLMIIRKPKVLGPTSQYLFSLAIADIGILIFNLPIGILKEEDPFGWPLGRTACLYVAPVTETFFGAAIFTITLIAFERYLNIARTELRVHRTLSRNRKRLALAIVWVVSFAVTSVPLFVYQEYDSCHRMCYHTWSLKVFLIYTIALTALLYVLPLAIIAFSYISIARLVSKRTNTFQDETSSRTDSHSAPQSVSVRTMLRQKRKTYRILKPLVIVFAVSMFPLTLLRLVLTQRPDVALQSYYTVLITIMVISTAMNSAADPMVYCIVNKEFRKHVKRLLGCNLNFLQGLNTFRRNITHRSKGAGSYIVSVEQTTQDTRL